MRACICLRGIHYSNDEITEYNNNKVKTDYRRSIENYKEYIIEPLKSLGYIVDIMIFTYDSRMLKELLKDYNPIYSNILPSSERNTNSSWNRQIIFHKNSVDAIKDIKNKLNYEYSLIVNTRFDLFFNTKITDMNIDYSKFNIVFKHPNGNCDDNLWVFNISFLDAFYESMVYLYNKSQMTHEINKYINNINYMHTVVGLNNGNVCWDDYVYWHFLRIKDAHLLSSS